MIVDPEDLVVSGEDPHEVVFAGRIVIPAAGHTDDQAIFDHDPTVEPTSLEVHGVNPEDGSTGLIDLDRAFWVSRGTGHGYHYMDFTGSRGGITEIQHFGRGWFVIEGGGDKWPWRPTNAIDGLSVKFTIGDETFCALFAEETGARLVQNRPGVFSAWNAAAPKGGCDSPLD